MSQSKHQIEALLAEAGSHPRHRFGQNFMIDQNLVRLVAEAGMLTPGDWVVEVGPGTGTLTEELLDRAGHVVAVEIDRDLAALLRSRFADLTPSPPYSGERAGVRGDSATGATRSMAPHPIPLPRVQGRGDQKKQIPAHGALDAAPHPEHAASFMLIEGDALAGKHELNAELLAAIKAEGDRPRKLVANLPYNIASPLIIELLIAGVDLLAFTVQKEVAMRLKAPAGSDDYGPLSVMAQMLAKVELLRTLPPQAFWPAPTIDSALARMTRHDRLGDRANEFGTFVHAIFSSRRKMLRKALAQAGYDGEALIQHSGLDGHRRPEEFSPEEIFSLFQTASNDS